MGKVARMTREERRDLVRRGRRSREPQTALRFLAVARLGAGRSTVQVAEELEVARSTVVAAADRFTRLGVEGLYDLRHFNGMQKAGDDFHLRVAELLARTPEFFGWRRPTWTRELLCLQMKDEGWPEVAVCTMGRVLARLGARLGVPKPVVLCPWKRDARERRLAKIRALELRASAAEPVLYEDEVDIHLNPKIGRDWMLPGQQRRVVTPGKNEKFYIAGALDVRTGKLIVTGADSKNAALFCDLLRVIAASYPRARKIHLILDNYGVHSSKAAKAALEELGGKIVLHFLPPYCPDANRIERVWQDLHANVTRNHRCKTMKQLLSNAHTYLTGYIWRIATGTTPLLRQAA
jgi:transposase